MRTLATKACAINQYNGLGNQLWDLAGNRPSLDLRFADNKSLVDATTGTSLVDHTRASSGTYVGSDGLIKTATTNYLLYSQDFSNAAWTKSNSAILSSNNVAPDGTATASAINIAATASSIISQSITGPSGVYTFSVWAKNIPGEQNYFDLILSVDGSPVQRGKTALTDSWQRYTVTSVAAGTSIGFGINNPPDNYAARGIFWGAQLEQSSTVGEYVKTTSTINSAPRFDHDPTTGESLGLLVEEERSNLLLNSETLSTQSVTVTAVDHALSFTGTGTVTLSGASSAGPLVGTGTGEANRVSLTFTPTAGSLTLTVSGTVTDAQLEEGSFPTSYIPTEGTTVTRAADVASISGSNFSSWYRQDEGTVFADHESGAGITSRRIVSINDATANNVIQIVRSNASGLSENYSEIVTLGSTQGLLGTGTTYTPGRQTSALAYATNNVGFAKNGGAAFFDNTVSIPTVSTLEIGSRLPDIFLNGTISRLTYWPTRLPNGTLQGITT